MSLVLRIVCGLAAGVALALLVPEWTFVGLLGELFVGALKAIAPVLVALLVTSSLASGRGFDRRFGKVVVLYLCGTFLAAIVAVAGSFAFPQTLDLRTAASGVAAPCGLSDVMK